MLSWDKMGDGGGGRDGGAVAEGTIVIMDGTVSSRRDRAGKDEVGVDDRSKDGNGVPGRGEDTAGADAAGVPNHERGGSSLLDDAGDGSMSWGGAGSWITAGLCIQIAYIPSFGRLWLWF